MRFIQQLAFLAVASLASMAIVQADEWDKKTTITIDEALQLPNMTLPAGTYVIRLADLSGQNRHVVQFFDKDEKSLVTTILAIPNERLEPTGKSVFAFWETPVGAPKALRAWFYPGDNFGQEFAYPKTEADRISARNNNAKVPVGTLSPQEQASNQNKSLSSRTETPISDNRNRTTDSDQVKSVTTAPPPTPPANNTELAQQNPAAPTQATPVPATPQQPPAAGNAAANQANPPESLPKTASELPLLAVLGLLAVGAAYLMSVVSSRG
jgi:hypothetical protein